MLFDNRPNFEMMLDGRRTPQDVVSLGRYAAGIVWIPSIGWVCEPYLFFVDAKLLTIPIYMSFDDTPTFEMLLVGRRTPQDVVSLR